MTTRQQKIDKNDVIAYMERYMGLEMTEINLITTEAFQYANNLNSMEISFGTYYVVIKIHGEMILKIDTETFYKCYEDILPHIRNKYLH